MVNVVPWTMPKNRNLEEVTVSGSSAKVHSPIGRGRAAYLAWRSVGGGNQHVCVGTSQWVGAEPMTSTETRRAKVVRRRDTDVYAHDAGDDGEEVAGALLLGILPPLAPHPGVALVLGGGRVLFSFASVRDLVALHVGKSDVVGVVDVEVGKLEVFVSLGVSFNLFEQLKRLVELGDGFLIGDNDAGSAHKDPNRALWARREGRAGVDNEGVCSDGKAGRDTGPGCERDLAERPKGVNVTISTMWSST